jgi:DNA-binding transcriptional LysR family regulator
MDLKKLRYFEAAAAEKTFRSAADRLHVTHSALSKQIAVLEQEIGCELFVRAKQRVELSTAGKIFLSHIRRILEDVDFAVRQAQHAAAGHLGSLRIGFRETAGRVSIVSRIFNQFSQAYPKIELQLEQMTTLAQCEALRRGNLDIGLAYSPPAEYKDLSRLSLLEEKVFLALPLTHPLAGRKRLLLKDLENLPFIGFKRSNESHYANMFTSAILKSGVTLNIVQEVESESAIMNLISIGAGVSTGIAENASLAPPGIVFKPIADFKKSVLLELVWVDQELSTLARNFVAVARKSVAGD